MCHIYQYYYYFTKNVKVVDTFFFPPFLLSENRSECFCFFFVRRSFFSLIPHDVKCKDLKNKKDLLKRCFYNIKLLYKNGLILKLRWCLVYWSIQIVSWFLVMSTCYVLSLCLLSEILNMMWHSNLWGFVWNFYPC